MFTARAPHPTPASQNPGFNVTQDASGETQTFEAALIIMREENLLHHVLVFEAMLECLQVWHTVYSVCHPGLCVNNSSHV